MSNIRVDVGSIIRDGTAVAFRSPVDCSQVTGLIVYYPDMDGNETATEFAFADAHGNNVGDIDHLFAENVVVKVILDVTSGMAFVQNADTNAYLEGRFNELDNVFVGKYGEASVMDFAAARNAGKMCFLEYRDGLLYTMAKANTSEAHFYSYDHANGVLKRASLYPRGSHALETIKFVKSINGIVPQEDGSITLDVGSGGTVTEEQIASAVEDYLAEHPVEGGIGASSIIDIEKYGITAIDYEPPFTEEMFRVAYANGVGIQQAIDDAKAAGLKELTIPAGNYPLCYHANAKDEINPAFKTNGVNLFGYGVKLYVIYDENGVNPYYKWTDAELEANGGVQNHYILMGKVIEADSNVEGFEIVGERGYRKHENSKYREFSSGIMISHWANSNVIKNCNIHHFSGDGISGNPTFENVYVSGDVECPSGKMVNGVIEPSTNSWLSPRMGFGHSVDFTKPAQIASTGYSYFIWTKKQLAVHCFTREEAYITTIRVSQGNPFLFPVGTFYVYVEMYSGGVLNEESVGSVNFRCGNMDYYGTIIDNCEVYLNQRGGISNVPSGSVIKNCTVHHNGGAYGDMPAFFDGTQFGIDIEDWYIDSLTIEGCTFYGQIHDVLFRCNKIRMKNCILHNIFRSLNYAVDVWLENCKFHGTIQFNESTEFGDKFAINCTADYGFPAEIKTVGTAITSANLDANNSNLLVFKDASGAVVFSVDLSYLGKKPGDEIVTDALLFDLDATKFTAEALVLNDNTGNASTTLNSAECIVENGVVQPGKATFGLVKCTWNNAPVLNTEMAFEVFGLGAPACTFADMSHKPFIGHGWQRGTTIATNETGTISGSFKSDAPYINASGGTGKPSGSTSTQIVLDDGTTKNSSNAGVPGYNADKYMHIVFNYHSDGTIVAYVNGYPCNENPMTTDFASWDFSSILNGFYLFHGNDSQHMAQQVLMSARMYNRCLTKEEIRNNLAFEAKKLGY